MDDKVLCTTEKPFEWKTIEDLNILSSVNMSDDLLSHGDVLSPRLLVGVASFVVYYIILSSHCNI